MTKLYAGLDVSLEMTSVCVVDEDGRICLEAKAPSEPAALIETLNALDGAFVRLGLEAGPLSQWLFFGLTDAGLPAVCIEALLAAREVLRRELNRLHLALLWVVKNDELCRRFMTVPGVGPVTALAFKTTIDRPERFRRSADVGAHLGLTPRQHQSGEIDRRGRITRCGDTFTRTALFAATNVMLSRTTQWTALKAWGGAARSSLNKAKVAVARKLAVIMHRMWRDETPFRWTAA